MLTILYYVDRRGGFVDNHVLRRRDYVDRRGGFVDNHVLRRDYVDRRGGFVDNHVLRRLEGRGGFVRYCTM